MKHLLIETLLALGLLSACQLYPVQSAADFAARQTAQAATAPPQATATLDPTATLAPPEATATEVVVEATLVATPAPECLIKGNINGRNEHIYYTPKSSHYKSVIIDPEHGEQWFCTPAEAETAGWRAAKN